MTKQEAIAKAKKIREDNGRSAWTLYSTAIYEGEPVKLLEYYGAPEIDLDITYKIRKIDGSVHLVHRCEMTRYVF
jgi:hypothetical protein